MKPNNIVLLELADGSFAVKLIDFGIAKIRDIRDRETYMLTHTDDAFGSPLYMSPEQGVGERLDARSDIYSLGCVMYEAVTGKSPFFDENPIRSVFKHINEMPKSFAEQKAQLGINSDLEKIVLKCLEKNPGHRYKDGNQLNSDLLAVANGQGLRWKPVDKAQVSGSPEKTPPHLLRSLAAFVIDFALSFFLVMHICMGYRIGAILYWIYSLLDPNFWQSSRASFSITMDIEMICVFTLILLYFFLFQISKLMATPGQILCGTMVVDKFGGRAKPAKVLLRSLMILLFSLTIVVEGFRLLTLIAVIDQSVKNAIKSICLKPWFNSVSGLWDTRSSRPRTAAIKPLVVVLCGLR